MTNRMLAKNLIEQLPEENLSGVVDYLTFLLHRTPLDDFDYELAKIADEDSNTQTISIEQLAQKYGISF